MKRSKTHRLLSAVLAILMVVTMFPVTAFAAEPANHVVINQAYGGGGNSGAVYTNDFVELYNPTNSDVSLDGWSVQYAAKTGAFNNVTSLSGTIKAKGYYLIQMAAGNNVIQELPTPDATGTASMAKGDFKVALVSNTEKITGKADADVVDFLGVGGANEYEGTKAAKALSNSTAALRNEDGVDTDDNAADFSAATPNARNSSVGGIVEPEDPYKDIDEKYSVYEFVEMPAAGDTVVIFNPGYGKMLSSTPTSYYLAGVDADPVDNIIATDADAIEWVISEEGGIYEFAQGDKKLAAEPSGQFFNLTTDANDATGWNMSLVDKAAGINYLFSSTLTGQYGNVYAEWYAQKDGFSAYCTGEDRLNTNAFGFVFYKLVREGKEETEPEVPPTDPEVPPTDPEQPKNTAEYTDTLANGDKVIIYYPKESKTMGTEVYTYVNANNGTQKDELVAVDGTVEGTILTYNEGTAILTVSVAEDGTYTFVSQDGKYLYLDGTNVKFADEAGDYTGFATEQAEGGFYINAPKAVVYSKVQYLEYYSGYFTCYGLNTSKADIYTFQFYKVEDGQTEEPEGTLKDGAKVVIYNPAHMKALSSVYNGFYNTGVDVTLSDNKLEGYTDAEIWTLGVNEDGTYTFSTAEGKKLSLGAQYSSMPLDDVNTAWGISEAATEGCYYIKNVARGNYVEWFADKNNWSSYYNIGNNEALFAQAFYVIPEEPPVEPEEPKGPVKDGDKVVVYNPAHMKALSSVYNGFYNTGVDVTLSDNKLEGYTDAEIWTVGVNEDGTYTFSTAEGKKLSLGAQYSSMPLDDVNTAWEISEAATEGCYYIKNVARGNYIEWFADKNNWSSYYNIGNNEALFAQAFYVIPEEAPEGGKLTSADQFVTGKYAMVVSGGYAMGKLNGSWIEVVQPVIEGDVVTDAKGGVWTLTVEGNSVTITDINGASVKPKGGNNNGIASGSYKWDWTFNEANGTFTFNGTGSDTVTLASNASEDPTYGGFHRFRGYKNNTVAGNPSTYPCDFTLYPIVEEVKESVLPSEGDKVVIYNLSAQGVLGAENDTQSINNVLANPYYNEELKKEVVSAEDGAVIFTVSQNGNFYRFYNEAYGYLCSNGTGNNAFYTQEASEDADWTLTAGKKGGWNFESRTAKFNGQYSQYLEYYADSYKTYSMYNVTDYDIYEFFFYPVDENTTLVEGVVHAPDSEFECDDVYLGRDWKVTGIIKARLAIRSEKVTVSDGMNEVVIPLTEEHYTTRRTGTETVFDIVVPAEMVKRIFDYQANRNTKARTNADIAVNIECEFENVEHSITAAAGKEILDEPSIGEVTPAANAQTGEDKRPVISAEITNAGADATVSMTVNGEAVVSVYDGEKVTYTPSSDMAEGRTTVVVTVVRADGKETSKTWSFTVGEAQYSLYFGQLHSHTTYSDGSGSLESALDYIAGLPESANVDFVAFTDHSNYFDKSGAANPEAALYDMSLATADSQKLWAEYTGAIDEFNASQSDVVALGGFEMTWSGGPGHINTFNTPGIVSRNNTTLNNKTNDAGMKAYYALLSQPEGIDSISQFNHPGSTFGTFTDFAYWDALIDTRIQLVEVGNGEGQIGAGGYYPSYEYYTMALDKGWHVSPTNNQDNHKGKWGNANDARDVVLTDDFSEAGIYQAIRDMRMYSTEDKNLEIGYTVNGLLLGSSITEVPEKLNIEVTVYDPDKADSISKVEVIVNSGKVAHTWDDPADLADGALSVELDPTYSYYYIRVTEGDGDLAVTSPVWVGESLKLGISSVECGTATPVTNEELTITTTLFNSESKDARIKSITYTANGGEVIGTDTGDNVIPASGTKAVDFKWTPTTAKLTKVTVTAVVDLEGVEYVFTMDIELDVQDADKLVYVGIDASHFNEYVAGNYKDSMGNFGNLAAGYGVRTVELKTSEDLVAACSNPKFKAIILTAPSRRNGNALRDPYATYSDAEISALVAFNEAGGTVVLTGWGDYYESYTSFPAEDHMAAQQNKVLEALGSSIRISDDETKDDSHNGGQAQRLYLSVYDFNSFLLDGVEYDAENPHNNMYTELYSQYGGASIYVVDGEGKPTANIPATVTPAVYGFDTTYSADDDKDSFGGLGSTQKYKVGDTEHLMVLASEELEGKGLIVVAGAAFLSNFEVQATIEDSGAEKNYSNYKICENLIKYLNPVSVTPIAEVQAQTEAGYKYTIEGIVTSNASGYDKDTAFFDCIYVQDATGGICCFPVAGNFKIGDKVRVTGTTEFYQGEMELQVTDIEVIGTGFMDPTVVTPAQINDRSVEGKLVTVKGILVRFEKENGLVQTIYVKDYNTDDVARVFIDGYITTSEDVKNLAIGVDVIVTGLASYDNTFNAPEGPFPRIRIRDRKDVVCGERAIVEVTFNAEGEETTKGYFFGSAMSNIPTATREGYKFLGWYDEDGVKLDKDYVLYKNTKFTARWEKVQENAGGDATNKVPTVIIDMNKDGSESNPETGAPVMAENNVSVFAAIAVLGAAAFVLGKRK